ncbi:MAG: DUF4190 domain-containing protein [Verrucomicrobiae bacterium]|nr:DUF4190 domain-containing protein [Verrucomicrobiae bacterium]
MAVIKVACPKCGQRVSGDESFYGTSVDCPICTSTIRFPDAPRSSSPPSPRQSRESEPSPYDDLGSEPAHREEKARRETSSIPLPPPPKSRERPLTPPGNAADLPSPVLGVVSMVVGMVSVVFFCLPGILLGPTAIICGHIARARARHHRISSPPGHRAALIGLILGYLSLAGFILIILLMPPVMDWLRETKAPN